MVSGKLVQSISLKWMVNSTEEMVWDALYRLAHRGRVWKRILILKAKFIRLLWLLYNENCRTDKPLL